MKRSTTIVALVLALLLSVLILGSIAWWGPKTVSFPSEAYSSDGVEASASATGSHEMTAKFPIMRATNPEEVREVLRLTRGATSSDRPALLHAALTAEDPLVAGNAVKALGRLKILASDPTLLDLIADPRRRVRQDAVIACGLDGSDVAIPYLEKAFAKGDASLQPLIIDALGKIGGPAASELIQRIGSDPQASQTDRVFARAALDRMRSSHIVSGLGSGAD